MILEVIFGPEVTYSILEEIVSSPSVANLNDSSDFWGSSSLLAFNFSLIFLICSPPATTLRATILNLPFLEMGLIEGVMYGMGVVSLGGDEGFSEGFAIAVFGYERR